MTNRNRTTAPMFGFFARAYLALTSVSGLSFSNLGRLSDAHLADLGLTRFDVPRALVRRGTNVLVFRFERAPIYRRMRGEGPRQVRPALLGALRLWRQD